MFDVSPLVAELCRQQPNQLIFEPTDVQLSDIVISTAKSDEETPRFVSVDPQNQPRIRFFNSQFPLDDRVIAIDSTSVVLGYVPEGLVGAIRASVILKPEGTTNHEMQRYGPYLVVVTNYNKDDLYAAMCRLAYGAAPTGSAPENRKTLDRLRNLLERYLQFQVVSSYSDSLVLIDGSLMAGAVADPMFVIRKLVHEASMNRNTVVALSKSTTLTLKANRLGILSLIDGIPGACYVGDLRERLTQEKDRYFGCVFVGRLTPQGESFRFDIPENTAIPHDKVFSMVSGISGEHGYPEELKLAHMTSVFSSIEVIELQAAAINLHGLKMKDNIRRKLFPM
jgi:hypothetical protein